MDFNKIYKEYKYLARLDRRRIATKKEQQQRLELRNYISELLIDEHPSTESLVSKAISSRTFLGKTYAEISAQMTDGNAFDAGDRREASLIETIANTHILKALAGEILEALIPCFDTIFIFGSYAYSLNLNIKTSSDLDFQVLNLKKSESFNDLKNMPWFKYPEKQKELQIGLAHLASGHIDNFGMKVFYRERQISFHFATKNLLKKICDVDFSLSAPNITEFRVHQRRLGFTYNYRYLFNGEKYNDMKCEYQLQKDGFINTIPLFQLDQKGRYLTSFFVDRFIVCELMHGDVSIIAPSLESLKKKLVIKMVSEEKAGLIKQGSLYNVLSRHLWFSKRFTRKILDEEYKIRKMIDQG